MGYYIRRSVATCLWLAVALVLAMALVSYSANDPSWSHLSSTALDTVSPPTTEVGIHHANVSNLLGLGGAWLADVLYTLLGAASWWLVIIAGVEACRVWQVNPQPMGAIRTIGYTFLVIATAALLGIIARPSLAHGILGQVSAQGLFHLLTYWGALVFLLVFVLLASVLTFDIPIARQNRKGKSLNKSSLPTVNTQRVSTETSETTAATDLAQGSIPPLTTVNNAPDFESQNLTIANTSDVINAEHVLAQFLDETGFYDTQLGEQVDSNEGSRPFQPMSMAAMANAKLTKRLDSALQCEVIGEQAVQRSTVNGNHTPIETKLQVMSAAQPTAAESMVPQPQTEPQTAEQWLAQSNLTLTPNVAPVQQENIDPTESVVWVEPVRPMETATVESWQTLEDATAKDYLTLEPTVVAKFIPDTELATASQTDSPLHHTDAIDIQTSSLEKPLEPSVQTVEGVLDIHQQAMVQEAMVQAQKNAEESFQAILNQDALATTSSALAEIDIPRAPISPMPTDLAAPVSDAIADEEATTVNDLDEIVVDTPIEAEVADTEVAAGIDVIPSISVHQRPVEIDSTLLDPVPTVQSPPINPATLEPESNSNHQPSHAMQMAAYRASLSALPELSLLELPDPDRKPSYSLEALQQLSELLEIKLQEFNVKATVVNAQLGPVVTRFEVELAAGVKVSKVTGIAKDLARSLSMASVRVVEVIPGKPYIGIEVPNPKRQMVRLIELLQTDAYRDPKALISMAMGKDIAGKPVLADLAKAPHMLVAGTTGSGKSVLVNSLLLSMLLKYTPSELRLILIDPKQLELANYNDIPHLLTPVVTDMTEAASALSWCVGEMERRYQLMSLFKVRKLDEFNKKVIAAETEGQPLLDPLWRLHDSVSQDKPPKLKPLPQIVVVADEFADMIMQVGKQAEELITRLAQKSRAAGIHLILATQRPSVDVITGLIKANIPVRAALRVNSKVDSRTILDAGGAEDMLGHGDMLFLGPGQNEPIRVHGAFISDAEVNRVCDAWRERGAPDYIDNMFDNFELAPTSGNEGGGAGALGDDDALYDEVVAFVMETRKVSASSIQRKFSIGYNRAARIVDAMEEAGLVSAMGKSGKRELLV